MSKSRRTKIKKKSVIVALVAILIIGLLAVVGVKMAKKKVSSTYGSSSDSEISTASVTTGSISTTVSGSGTLADEDVEDYTIPAAVEIEEIYVSEGQSVEEGDLLASVKTSSLVSAMSDLQEQIDAIDDEIAEASDDKVSSKIKTKVTGRVKAIYAKKGSDVATVMYEKGALAVLSLDGYMAVDIETDSLKAGKSVKVKVGSKTYTGKVDQVKNGTATVLISDKTASIGKKATVKKNGETIGSGKLYVHQPLYITGYAGTVKSVKLTKNKKISAGSVCFTLKDTSYSANYETLLDQRDELEEKLQTIVEIYKEGAFYAKMSGTISSITEGSSASTNTSTSNSGTGTSMGSGMSSFGSYSGSASGSGTGTTTTTTSSSDGSEDTVFSICPDEEMSLELSIDESNILSLKKGQAATVTVDSIGSETFEGTVTDISRTASSSNGVTSYTATVTIEKTSQMLNGMSASATITIEGVDNALLIPVDAVQKTSSTYYVYTSYDEETKQFGGMVEITVGISNSSYYEVTSGLSEGDTVYYTESSDSNSFGNFGGGMPGNFGGSGSGMPSGMPGGSGSGMPSGMPGNSNRGSKSGS